MTHASEAGTLAAYEIARERYAGLGVKTEEALARLAGVSISLDCWQGDDLAGFEDRDCNFTAHGATARYPGRARNAAELRRDLDLVYTLLPGRHRLNLHAMYAETGGRKVARNELLPEHFNAWKDWAKASGHGLDFNPTCFSSPLAGDGFTLSHRNPGIRRYWIEHCIASRRIGEFFGRELGTPAVTNIWIPDGFKDTPVDRMTPRLLLRNSLDNIFAEKLCPGTNFDALEPKLFGIGSESYVTGSMEFYTAYAVSRNVLLTLDSGHFHPTESIADKLSSLLLFLDRLVLHVSRGVRWDSDHVVTYGDDLLATAQEVIHNNALERMHICLDFFDASINRIAAWVIGARNVLRALLAALLEPLDTLRRLESDRDYTGRLALLEELKGMPSSSVWDYHCLRSGVPVGMEYIGIIRDYEKDVLSRRL
ncbi:MAG: L-rhamnose isomerase [Actinobacteria bacterium]|jgi:L-rhamnose isomerase|nr:MAG: L-rhamnose isomerase [Actinomycetota bacterium]